MMICTCTFPVCSCLHFVKCDTTTAQPLLFNALILLVGFGFLREKSGSSLCQCAFFFSLFQSFFLFRSKDLKTEKSERYMMSEPNERLGALIFISPLNAA